MLFTVASIVPSHRHRTIRNTSLQSRWTPLRLPKRHETSIRARLDNVDRAFKAEAFLSAVSLALTLPDVCGSRLYPNNHSRERYEKWFDKYVADAYLDSGKSVDNRDVELNEIYQCYFCGADCYQLRCVYLHEGTNATHNDKKRTLYNVIQFRLFDDASVRCDHIGETWEGSNGVRFRQVDLDLCRFFRCVREGAERFLDDYPEMNEDNGSNSIFYKPLLDFRS